MTDPLVQALLDKVAADPEAIERLRELLMPPAAKAEPWVGVEQAADHIGAKRQRIYDLVHADRIPHRRDGTRLLFRLSELDESLNKG